MCNFYYPSQFVWRVILLGWIMFNGCSHGDRPELGYVTGTVTMDGKPLAKVIVTFKPTQGRPSVGMTDENGDYHLEYSYQVPGTKVGLNQVAFSWPIGVAGSHVIPARYSGKSDINRDVQAGSNSFDFDLESDPKAEKQNRTRTPSD